jgi:phage-related minor tail protein
MADDLDAVSGSASDLSVTLDALTVRTRGLEAGANGFARAMTQAFTSAAIGGKRFEDVLKSLALRLSDLSLKLALKPLTSGIASGLQGLFPGLLGTSALNASDAKMLGALGDVQPFADGGVIAAPRYFPLGASGVGLAGEAGPEAILPLARGADGKLGIAASGGGTTNVTIHIATPDAASFHRSEAFVTGAIARAVARGQRSL